MVVEIIREEAKDPAPTKGELGGSSKVGHGLGPQGRGNLGHRGQHTGSVDKESRMVKRKYTSRVRI